MHSNRMPTARSGTEISCQSALYRSGGGLCPGKGGLSGGSLFGGGLCVQENLRSGVSVPGGLRPGGSVFSGDLCQGDPLSPVNRLTDRCKNITINFVCEQ